VFVEVWCLRVFRAGQVVPIRVSNARESVGLPVHVETSSFKVSGVRRSPGTLVLPEDEIWQNAQDVWNELPNSKVASAYYVQAYRIADKVIQAKGDRKFLGPGGSIDRGIGNHLNLPKVVLNKLICAPNH
jgi:hypothetical protein